jgi:hypothetical protein
VSHFGFLNVRDPALQDQGPTDRTRRFEGEGKPILPVPGLLKLESVRLGTMRLPLEERREFPADDMHLRKVNIGWGVVQLDYLPDNTPVLLRNFSSNDGVWQAHSPVWVTGEWDDAVPAPEIEAEVEQKPRKGLR